MIKQEAKKVIWDWLVAADQAAADISIDNFDNCKEWFSRCSEMQSAFVALFDPATSNEMPIDPPSPEFVADEIPENAFDGVNGFERK